MSTKNLARTAIEGGRYFSASWLCRYENRALRTGTRGTLAGVAIAIGSGMGRLERPAPSHVGSGFVMRGRPRHTPAPAA